MPNYFLCILLVIFTFKIKAQEYSINFIIEGLNDQELLFGAYVGETKFILDTAYSDQSGKGSFSFSDTPENGLYFILFQDSRYFELLIEDFSGLTVETTSDSLIQNLTVSGDRVAEGYVAWMKEQMVMNNTIQQKQHSLLNEKLTSDSLDILRHQIRKLKEKASFTTSQYISKHEGDFLAVFLSTLINAEGMSRPQFTGDIQQDSALLMNSLLNRQNQFFKNYDFSSEGLTRTPVLPSLINRYYTLFPPADTAAANSAVEFILNKAIVNKKVYQFTMRTMFNYFQDTKMPYALHSFLYLAQNYYLTGKADWIEEDFRKEVADKITRIKKNRIGEKLNFPSMEKLDGAVFNIDKVRNKFFVLYFWDVNCFRCKKDIPALRELEWEYRKEDIKVIAIYTGDNRFEWKKFVDEYDMDWVNVWDPHNMSLYRENLNVTQTPQYYLIDIQHVIVDKGYTVSQLRDFLQDFMP